MAGAPARDVVVALAVVAGLAGCSGREDIMDVGPAPPADEDTVEQLHVDGVERRYRLFVPDSAPDPAPVVVMLHDAGGSPESIVEVTGFDGAARRGGFAVAYPEGLAGGTWNVGFCCGPAPEQGHDDLGFLDRVVDAVGDHPGIAADRVYLAGVSNGAILALRYACDHPRRVVGVASVAGAMLLDDCRPTAAVSVLEVHGTADRIVPFDGGDLPEFARATRPVPATTAMVEHWADANGCSDPTVASDGPVTTTTWTACEDGAVVELVAVEGASHAWYAPEFGPVDGAVDATATITAFFGLDDAR